MTITDVANPPKLTLIERQALAVPARPVIAQAEFLTLTRNDLFTLTRRLMGSISPLALRDPSKPIIVSVRGSFEGGKKIFPDAARENMFCLAPDFEGQKNDYELWRGIHNGKDFEIDFYNCFHTTNFNTHRDKLSGVHLERFASSDEEREKLSDDARTEFLSLRQHGGITFLHNNEKTAEYDADIDIRLEGKSCAITYDRKATKLTEAFNVLSASHSWARHIRIEVKNQELMQHKPFAREIESLKRPSETIGYKFYKVAKVMATIIPSAATHILAHNNVPIYGVNIARPAQVLRQG